MARTTIREEDITSGAVPTTGIVGVSTFTSSGTWTKTTREAALGVTIKRVIVEVQGAGGGGGGGDNYGSQGGGGGGYAKKLIDVSSISSATITVGAFGAAGTGINDGSAGGNSIWSDGTNTVTGSGGGGGKANDNTTNNLLDNKGAATGGDLNIAGQLGARRIGANGNPPIPAGLGGDSMIGHGGVSGSHNAIGDHATGYGSGGAGGSASGTGNNNGAPGRAGIVIVTEIAG